MTIESIAKTLGSGSGIDLGALVTSLVDAQFANKSAMIERREETLTAQVSAVARLKSGITGFSSALTGIVNSGALQTQPVSGDALALRVAALPGAKLAGLSASVDIRQLATGQVTHSALIANRTAPIGQGTLTLTLGTAEVIDGQMTGFAGDPLRSFAIEIGAGNSSLDGIAAAINAKRAGVTASVVGDASGARLVLKGPTGATQAFTLSATEAEGQEGLAALAVGIGSTVAAVAQNAVLRVDGVEVERGSNSISDLIAGVRLDLVKAQPGTTVTIGTQPPTDALKGVVQDFVATYNDLLALINEDTNPLGGPLARDSAASTMKRALAQLTLTPLASGQGEGAPTTLAAIGIATNRDGTLRIDDARLTRALTTYPDAVEAMFARGTAASGDGIAAALSAVATRVTGSTTGLGASQTRYTRQQEDLGEQREKALAAAESMRTRMTRQFASMDAQVAAYKSTQAFLTQQVDAWNADR